MLNYPGLNSWISSQSILALRGCIKLWVFTYCNIPHATALHHLAISDQRLYSSWSLPDPLLSFCHIAAAKETLKNMASVLKLPTGFCCQSLRIKSDALQWPTVGSTLVSSSQILVNYCLWPPSPSFNNSPGPVMGPYNYYCSDHRLSPHCSQALLCVAFHHYRQAFLVYLSESARCCHHSLHPHSALFSFIAFRATWYVVFTHLII